MRTLLHFYKSKPEWFNELYAQVEKYSKNKKIITILFVIFSLFFILFVDYKQKNLIELISTQNKRSEISLRQLNEINSVIHNLEINPSNTKSQLDTLHVLEKNIEIIKASMIDIAKNTDIQKVSNQVESIKDEINSQLGDLKTLISQSIGKKDYLDASTLPFHVISIDVIAGQPYVSVQYENIVSPLSIGDLLAGWRVINISFESGIVEFENEKDQYIKVSLQGS